MNDSMERMVRHVFRGGDPAERRQRCRTLWLRWMERETVPAREEDAGGEAFSREEEKP